MKQRSQTRLLAFIESYQRQSGGVSPSFKEMQDATGRGSYGGLTRSLDRLEAQGFIRRLPNKRRAIEVLRLSLPKQPPFAGAIPIYDADTHQIRGWLS